MLSDHGASGEKNEGILSLQKLKLILNMPILDGSAK